MKLAEIINLTRDAGFSCDCWMQKTPLERFANLVAAAAREDCAKVCESGGATVYEREAGKMFARKIRSRNEPPKNGD